MNNPGPIVEAVGAWLHFEYRCGRRSLFSESYLSYPLGQVLRAHYGRRVRPEFIHPLLTKKGRGDKRRLDFAVLGDDDSPTMAIELKWLASPTKQLPLVMRDLIRLELLRHEFDSRCFFLLCGPLRAFRTLFSLPAFRPDKARNQPRPLLPYTHGSTRRVDIKGVPPSRRPLMERTGQAFLSYDIPRALLLSRVAPYPQDARLDEYVVYGWRVDSVKKRGTFRPLPMQSSAEQE